MSYLDEWSTSYISNKLFEIRQYRNKLPEDVYGKIKEFADKNIRPMAYDADFWSFIEKDESCGSYNEENHFIIDSDRSLENIIFRKYNHVHDLLMELSNFMSEGFSLNYDWVCTGGWASIPCFRRKVENG